MKFVAVPSPFDDMQLFGAKHGLFTFVISHDSGGMFSASVKAKGSKPFDGQRTDLGYRTFKSFDEAKAACEKFINDRN